MKQPYEMTKEEFNKSFPLFTELSPRVKWRLYRILNKVNLQETGEECTWEEFCEFVREGFRWDVEEANVLVENSHAYFIGEALANQLDIPSDVLAEYPDLVEEHINKRIKQKREQQKRLERRQREKEEKLLSESDKAFWSSFR